MPGLRENIIERLSREITIDPEFAALIPPLTPDEFSGLEQSILSEGCRDAIIVWDNLIVDGHNRYKICTEHNIPYRVETKDFKSRDEAMLWMLQNQLSRRNLNDFQRVEMVRKFEYAVKAQAEQRMLKGKADPMEKITQGTSRDTLGAMAGVSGKTYEHATEVLDNAPAPIVEAVRNNDISINAAYELTKLPAQAQQEAARRISQGEAPRTVVSQVKQHSKSTANYWSKLIPNAKKAIQESQNLDSVIKIVRETLELLEKAAADKT